MEKRIVVLLILLYLGLALASAVDGRAEIRQGAGPETAQTEKTEVAEEVIVPGPKDIKQEISLYVFIGWLWLCIAVCIFFLRLKIKESDRLLLLNYFSKDRL